MSRVNFATAHAQVDVVERDHAGELFGNAPHFQQSGRGSCIDRREEGLLR